MKKVIPSLSPALESYIISDGPGHVHSGSNILYVLYIHTYLFFDIILQLINYIFHMCCFFNLFLRLDIGLSIVQAYVHTTQAQYKHAAILVEIYVPVYDINYIIICRCIHGKKNKFHDYIIYYHNRYCIIPVQQCV